MDSTQPLRVSEGVGQAGRAEDVTGKPGADGPVSETEEPGHMEPGSHTLRSEALLGA